MISVVIFVIIDEAIKINNPVFTSHGEKKKNFYQNLESRRFILQHLRRSLKNEASFTAVSIASHRNNESTKFFITI